MMFKWIRRLKLAYVIYNIFHRRHLLHNLKSYKNLGLNKKYFSPISSKDFESFNSPVSSNATNIKDIQASQFYQKADIDTRNQLIQFHKRGYAILSGFLNSDTVESINLEVDRLVSQNAKKIKKQGRLMFAIDHSHLLRQIGANKKLIAMISELIDGPARLFQSINFMHGSQQKTHSDSIHMTTFPVGGMCGLWIALEDVTTQNGPLHYYPGSHSLPYYLNKDYDNEGNYWMTGRKNYSAYEQMIHNKLKTLKLEKEIFMAHKGDAIIWHANLLHGGEPQLDPTQTRKSMVFHYFNSNSICYHEITQRPALLRQRNLE